MTVAALPPPALVADEDSLERLALALALHPAVAVDTESNSLHAYRERVCLIQLSTADADVIVDPIRVKNLEALAPLFANQSQQKIFHAAENDLACLGRDYHFAFANIFDTMTAARTLGWPQVGLGSILETRFGVKLNKKYQRSDWGRRPLSAEQIDYARFDTHYLLALRDLQIQALTESGRLEEAEEEFARLARMRADADKAGPDPAAFWRVSGARDLSPAQAAVLQALFAYREQQAELLDRPPFKVMGESTLMELVRRTPRTIEELQGVPGMTPEQTRRFGPGLLQALGAGLGARGVPAPQVPREPEEISDRYDRLHTWRKNRAKARGVESDVILPRSVLWDLARQPPKTIADLARITDMGPWRRDAYGAEIVALLSHSPKPRLSGLD